MNVWGWCSLPLKLRWSSWMSHQTGSWRWISALDQCLVPEGTTWCSVSALRSAGDYGRTFWTVRSWDVSSCSLVARLNYSVNCFIDANRGVSRRESKVRVNSLTLKTFTTVCSIAGYLHACKCALRSLCWQRASIWHVPPSVSWWLLCDCWRFFQIHPQECQEVSVC